jgi:hypothetical protein
LQQNLGERVSLLAINEPGNGRGAAAEHLARRGARLDVEGAAGVGRLDIVKTFFDGDGTLKPDATRTQLEYGLAWACEYGRTDVVEFLLQRGVPLDAASHGETGLHWAAYNAHVDIVKLLLAKDAPLHLVDKRFRGTPLSWALYGWHDPSPDAEAANYYEVVALLTAAGAKADREWLSGARLIEKIDKDPRMIAALAGELRK